jgi:DNA (cytosine-5)-methyltransferase 1
MRVSEQNPTASFLPDDVLATPVAASGTAARRRAPNRREHPPHLPFDAADAPVRRERNEPTSPLSVVGLFAGIGGIEVGLHQHGHHTTLLCEIDEAASCVLRAHFRDVSLEPDVRAIRALPAADLLVAGFPCQDLSQAGHTAGITGARSGLVAEVFRLLESAEPRWLLLENVPFMLSLDRGEAMRFLTSELERLGFKWCYRVVNTQAFGLPQRRHRVLMLASRTEDPREVLLCDEAGEPPPPRHPSAYGFYWTEGRGGLGWAVDAVPTLKGGSTIGIPSAPAIWIPETHEIVTPDIRDVERLQGFLADWTAPAVSDGDRKRTSRWKLVGNAVSVPVAAWVGECLRRPRPYDGSRDTPLGPKDSWPIAAWSMGRGAYTAPVSQWPRHEPALPLLNFLQFPTQPLSARAAQGFLSRAREGSLKFVPHFLDDVEAHIKQMLRAGVRGR